MKILNMTSRSNLIKKSYELLLKRLFKVSYYATIRKGPAPSPSPSPAPASPIRHPPPRLPRCQRSSRDRDGPLPLQTHPLIHPPNPTTRHCRLILPQFHPSGWFHSAPRRGGDGRPFLRPREAALPPLALALALPPHLCHPRPPLPLPRPLARIARVPPLPSLRISPFPRTSSNPPTTKPRPAKQKPTSLETRRLERHRESGGGHYCHRIATRHKSRCQR